MRRCLLLLAGVSMLASADSVVGDAESGRQVFETLKCATCHNARELKFRTAMGNTPAGLSAAMWNHAPQMWAAMEKAGVAKPKLTTQQAADLFAWFQAARYFEKAGDAGRGKRAFEAKGCAGCHTGAAGPGGWRTLGDPIELARQMWNHAPAMQAAMLKKGAKGQEVTAAEMNDIVAYAASLGAGKGQAGSFSPGPAPTGQTLLEVKGCNGCHKGAQALPGKTAYTASAEIAAAMWNHAARMKHTGEMRPEEMRRIVGYLWSRQYENEGGDAARGEKLFVTKACAGCHGSSAPYFAHGEESSSYGMAAVLWYHGPQMLVQMKVKKVAWPQFTGSEISDVIAFLKASK
jgi:cytochrome c551/c552